MTANGGTSDRASGIRVLLVDDHAMLRRLMATVLSEEEDLTVVGECADGSQVVEAAARLRPDIVCMDLSMPVMDGLRATEALSAARSEARVIVLTGEGAPVRAKAAVAGALAVVPKGTRLEELLSCIRTVAADGTGCPYCL
jgi:DNA-binding NarL/FixJ family response regulator